MRLQCTRPACWMRTKQSTSKRAPSCNMTTKAQRTTALKVLIALACAVICVAGLKAAEVVFVPVLLAVFLAFLGQAPVVWLREKGLPSLFAASVVGLLTAGALAGVGIGLLASLAEFKSELPQYRDLLGEFETSARSALSGMGLDLSTEQLRFVPDGEQWTALATQALGGGFQMASFAVLVLAFVFFVLLEFSDFREKLRYLAGEARGVAALKKSCRQVRRYVAVKSFMCALTGLGVGILFFAADIRFALLWAILAFVFNYVPIVGSAVAALPPLALALLDHGPGAALVVLVVYVVINLSVSNFLEPILMGDQLGLSPLSVFLALVFWGWLWGPAGMLLAVPLSRIAKIFLENTEELSWAAILMGRLPRGVRVAPLTAPISPREVTSSLSPKAR